MGSVDGFGNGINGNGIASANMVLGDNKVRNIHGTVNFGRRSKVISLESSEEFHRRLARRWGK